MILSVCCSFYQAQDVGQTLSSGEAGHVAVAPSTIQNRDGFNGRTLGGNVPGNFHQALLHHRSNKGRRVQEEIRLLQCINYMNVFVVFFLWSLFCLRVLSN